MSAPSPPFRSIPDQLRDHALAQPEATALVCASERASYRSLHAAADRIAAALQRDGLGPGTVVATCAGNSIGHVAAFLGALRAGAAVAPLPTSATPEQLAAMFANGPARLVFTDAATAPLMRNAGLADLAVALDGGERVATLEGWLAGAPPQPRPVEIAPHWPFNIIYSSGTTGAPKGIAQTHARRAAHAARAPSLGYGPGTVTLLATPLYSNTTLVALFPSLAAGATTVLMPRFGARDFLALAERERATHTMLVPIQYQRIMALPDFDAFDLSSFRLKQCAGAPFAAELKREVLRRWPGGLVEYYGTTEGGGSCLLEAHRFPDKLHTVGRPAAGSELLAIDDQGLPLPAGRAGEIVGRSAVMMEDYHNRPGRPRETEWFDAQGRRFLRSGDVGYFDDDGFLVLVDRKKDMIISGGFNVYPSDLEAALRQHPCVAEAAVVGVPSERWGETPVAFVVLRRAAEADGAALLDWCNARVGKTQRLAAVHLVDRLPRNALGKVLKRELRERWLPVSGDNPARVVT